jgi:hypothetical protein
VRRIHSQERRLDRTFDSNSHHLLLQEDGNTHNEECAPRVILFCETPSKSPGA